jgi:hypothetical protein
VHRYTGSDHRTYPYARIGGGVRPLQAGPGVEVEFDEVPADGRWEEITPAPKKKALAPAKAVQE